jgi:deazaflavin-dependent oxidoreductase (nitroreductase family)
MLRRLAKWTFLLASATGVLVFAWTRIPVTAWYRDRRPTRFGKATNRVMGAFAATGAPAFGMVTLEVPGRKSGRLTSTVLVLTRHAGEDYLVSMLGKEADWVKNVTAAGGEAVIRHGGRRNVRLEEVPETCRSPILRAYLKAAPGGRPHIPVAMDAPEEDIQRVAGDFPVYVVRPRAVPA